MGSLNLSQKDLFFKEIEEFVSTKFEKLVIICPYIKPDILDKLLNNCKDKEITIITSWKPQDLLMGSSDIELYTFCKRKGIFLYINNRVHLKALIKDYETCIFGSANISGNGLGLNDNYNYELFSMETKIGPEEILYFDKILYESYLVDDRVYNFYKDKIKDLDKIPPTEEFDLTKVKLEQDFLMSSLPMSQDTNKLYRIYSEKFKSGTKEEIGCALHDKVIYRIPDGLNKENFIKSLKKSFFDSKFIIKILEPIDEKGIYFHDAKAWIKKNCVDVPVPSNEDFKTRTHLLYDWIVELSEGKYKWDRPGGYSQRIYKVK